jgi:hypothetical protein
MSWASGPVLSEPCVSHSQMVSTKVRWEVEIVRKTVSPIRLASIAADSLPVGSLDLRSGHNSMYQPSAAR